MNPRHVRRRKRWEAIGSELLQLLSQPARLLDQPLYVDVHTSRAVRLELCQSLAELGNSAAPVPPLPVVEANPDLKDALIEVSNRVRFLDPDPLEGFVLLEELLVIELLDAFEQRRRRRVLTS